LIAHLRPRPVLLGAVLLFAVLALAYSFSVGLRATRGASITADEPFYLMTTVSLIDDGNLDLKAQYARESYREFFDHREGLWRQSVETSDGMLLSPHEPGLSALVIPGYLIDSLRGVQVQMLLLTALTFALAYVLVSRETGLPLLSWLVTAAVGLTATAFVYATEIYPEVPAALCLVSMLLVLQARGRDAWSALAMALLVTALLWFGMKYAPLGALLALAYLWQAEGRGRLCFLGLCAVSGVAYVWFHYAVFEDLTAYSVNTVYEGADAASVLQSHVSIPDRAYRLYGLFVDQRFGIGRWAPLLLLVPASLPLLLSRRVVSTRASGATSDGMASRNESGRVGQGDRVGRSYGVVRLTVLALIVTQLLIATFVAITMMGWWFPGRTMMAVLPLTALPLTLLLARLPGWGRAFAGLLAGVSLAFTVALHGATANGGSVNPGEVTLAVDPFEMAWWPFRQSAHLFPNYQTWSETTWLLTVAWVTALLASMGFVVWREFGGVLKALPRRRLAPEGGFRLRRADPAP
jgi:hypothetical protein